MINTNQTHADHLDFVFQALGDATRRAMLETLCRGEQRVTELAAPHRMSLNAVSKHIKILERAQLVTRRIAGRDHFLQINHKQFQVAQRWLAKQQAFWSKAMQSISEQLEQEDAKRG